MSNISVKELISFVKSCSVSVLDELGSGWSENIYQKAIEVALRNKGITYETQRNLPISYANHVVGEVVPDFVIWTPGDKRVAIIVDLKVDSGIKQDHKTQVERYIKELRKQIRSGESVHPTGLVINFLKDSTNGKIYDGVEDFSGIQALEVSA